MESNRCECQVGGGDTDSGTDSDRDSAGVPWRHWRLPLCACPTRCGRLGCGLDDEALQPPALVHRRPGPVRWVPPGALRGGPRRLFPLPPPPDTLRAYAHVSQEIWVDKVPVKGSGQAPCTTDFVAVCFVGSICHSSLEGGGGDTVVIPGA